MHPAPSVILFTTLSGLGFGLLFWLGLGFPPVTGTTALVFFFIAYLLAVGGLLASTFHLARPSRAIRAFTQWRSSWLSREAWCSTLALIIMALFGLGLIMGHRWGILGLAGAVFSIVTVFTTSMIYTQLRSVPRWNMPLTPALFLAYALAGGALMAGQVDTAIPLLIVAGLVQIAHWKLGDRAWLNTTTTLRSATGLSGQVRAFEPPHTGDNYLLRKMVHVVGRKHARKLRVIAITLAVILPVILLVAPFSHAIAGLAVLSHLIGVLASRWLFFAEAEHVVGLYYGKR